MMMVLVRTAGLNMITVFHNINYGSLSLYKQHTSYSLTAATDLMMRNDINSGRNALAGIPRSVWGGGNTIRAGLGASCKLLDT